MTTTNANPYLALGVRPFINCCSVRTMHGGSLMLPKVRAAIDAASRQFVNLDELMEAAGKRIAELTGAEWGIVTCGSAAAVALGTAACVAGNDPAKMLRLPFTDGMVNRVIIPKKQRFAYDQAVRMIGCYIVEIDTREELDHAFEEPVAMVVLLGKQEHLTAVRLEEIAAVCKPQSRSWSTRPPNISSGRARGSRAAPTSSSTAAASSCAGRRPADSSSAKSASSRRPGATARRIRRWAGR
jgi:hypothetical protein